MMEITQIIQQIVNITGIAGIYMTFAIGMSMVYAVMRVFHIAHGGVLIIGAYTNLFLFTLTRNIVVSTVGAMLVAAFAGLVIQTLLYTPILRKRVSNWQRLTLIASLGANVAITEGFLRFVGAKHLQYPIPFNSFIVNILGVRIFLVQLAAITIAVATMIGLWLFLMRTRMGRSLRAVSQDWELATSQGINPYMIFYVAMIIGSVFAGLAGVLTSTYYNDVYPEIGELPNLVSFAVIILGGLGSFPGTILGAVTVAAVEVLTFAYLPISAVPRGAISFIILLFVLALRPQGILGQKWK